MEVSLWKGLGNGPASQGRARPIVIRAEAEYNHFAKYRLGWRQSPQAIRSTKLDSRMLSFERADHLIPGLDKARLAMAVATPLTFEDQGGRSGGAVAGWSWDV